MAEPRELARSTSDALRADWIALCEASRAVQSSLDAALDDLMRTTVEHPHASYPTTCARVRQTIDDHILPHRNQPWAVASAEALKLRILERLCRQFRDART